MTRKYFIVKGYNGPPLWRVVDAADHFVIGFDLKREAIAWILEQEKKP